MLCETEKINGEADSRKWRRNFNYIFMLKISKNRTGTADYRMTGAVGAETTLNNTGELKILKSRGNDKIIGG